MRYNKKDLKHNFLRHTLRTKKEIISNYFVSLINFPFALMNDLNGVITKTRNESVELYSTEILDF